MSGATNTSRVHSKSGGGGGGGGGIYNNRRSNTSKGWVSPRKVPPPPPPPHPTHHTGSAGHLDWTVELLWPHPPDVQACTSMYAVNSCSPYTVYGIGQGGDLPLPPLSTPWFAPNLNNPGRRPTVYHIHTQQGQQNREKANSIGRRPIV